MDALPVTRRPARPLWPAAVAVAVCALAVQLAGTAAAGAWATVFVAICVQATPYLVLGTVVSAIVRVLPVRRILRVISPRSWLAVPLGAVAGCLLPGCECGSVPVAAALLRSGAPPGAATAFLLSAPTSNPVVLAATAAAFPGRPLFWVARLTASLGTAIVMGALCQVGLVAAPAPDAHSHALTVTAVAHEVAASIGLLSAAAAVTAGVLVAVPPTLLSALGSTGAIACVAVAGAAIVLGVCSSADAFIASSLTTFSPTAQLVFMVVGPAAGVKVGALQAGTFGTRFAVRLLIATFGVSLCAALLVGRMLL